MEVKELVPNVIILRANDPDRKIFDSIFPLKKGTTYNSYIVKGSEKTALIDTVDPSKKDEFIKALDELSINIDYIISNHSEQDHSGSIPYVIEKFPKAKIISTAMGKKILSDFFGLSEDKFLITKELDLGGKTLKFIEFPWAHWPETMLTYLVEDKILFTCDVFGAHYSNEDYYNDKVYDFAKQYYGEIMMPFRKMIASNLKKIPSDLEMICPSHGPIHTEPQKIISLYEYWTSDKVSNEVSIVYTSMHGDTEKIVHKIYENMNGKGIKVNLIDVSGFNISDLMKNLVDAKNLIIATPTVLGGPHPAILLAASLIKAYKPKLKNVSFIVMYEWGTNADKILSDLMSEYDIVGTLKLKCQEKNELDEFINKIINVI